MKEYDEIIEMLNDFMKSNKEELEHHKGVNDTYSHSFYAGVVCGIANCIDTIKKSSK